MIFKFNYLSNLFELFSRQKKSVEKKRTDKENAGVSVFFDKNI